MNQRKLKMPNDVSSIAIPQTDNIKIFPSLSSAKEEKPKRSWWLNRAFDLGVISMPNPEQNKEWTINKTNFFGWVGIIATFLTLAYFIYNKGVENGRQLQTIEQLQDDVRKAQSTGDKAIQIYGTSAKTAGHEENTNTEKK